MAAKKFSSLIVGFMVLAMIPAYLGCTSKSVEGQSSNSKQTENSYADSSARNPAAAAGWVQQLPGVSLGKSGSHEDLLAAYMKFLKISDEKKEKDSLTRLKQSVTQFLYCDKEDWECLESIPVVQPAWAFRVDSVGYGKPVLAGKEFKITSYFTKQWYLRKRNVRDEKGNIVTGGETVDPKAKRVAAELADLLKKKWDGVSMAIYGIDGIGEQEVEGDPSSVNTSMVEVFKGIKKQFELSRKAGTKSVNAVFDWCKKNDRIGYYYPPTEQLEKFMVNATFRDSDLTAIMHNKFFVFEKSEGGRMAPKMVWTGTANITKNCMGDEDFANMALVIENDKIAQAFKDEFLEMYEGKKFHDEKQPNTNRYFKFDDGTEVRVHFSPTDDGEHRAILPMVHSALPGDTIRISMYGSGGAEIVRALQFAARRGVIVKVFSDQHPDSGRWINMSDPFYLPGPNPYDGSGEVRVRIMDLEGDFKQQYQNVNHMKVGSLTRKNGKAEVIIIGSQNWSASGNDSNDENMVSIRNKNRPPKVAVEFNKYFDTMLWPIGLPSEEREKKAKEKAEKGDKAKDKADKGDKADQKDESGGGN